MNDDEKGGPPADDPDAPEEIEAAPLGTPTMLWGALRGVGQRVVDPVTKRFAPPTIDVSLSELRDDGPTAALLRAMDFVVPGEWENPRDLDTFVADALPDADESHRAKIRAGAVELYMADGSPYRRALAAYSAVDLVDRAAAATSLAIRIGNRFLILGALEKLTPRTEVVQAVDAAVKLVAEAIAFSALHGRPEATLDGLSDFIANLGQHAHEDRLRLATWVVVDGVLPLGPGFVQRAVDILRVSGEANLVKSLAFGRLAGVIPGVSVDDKGAFLTRSLESVRSSVDTFVEEHGLDRFNAADRVRQVVDVAESGFEFVAAAADAVSSYYRHTGTQTVARAVVRDAAV